MFKNFIRNVAFSACLVSTLMSGEGWGMTEIENNTNDTKLIIEDSIISNTNTENAQTLKKTEIMKVNS